MKNKNNEHKQAKKITKLSKIRNNENIISSNKEENINDSKNNKLSFDKFNSFYSSTKKLIPRVENNKNYGSITHIDFSNIFKVIDNSHQELKNKKNKTFYKSKSQGDFTKNNGSFFKDRKLNIKKIKIFKTKKYEFWDNPFYSKLNHDVYKYSSDFLNKFRKIKQKKKEISLEHYQKKLINISSTLNFSKDSIDRLSNNLRTLREKYSVKIQKSKKFIKRIEEKEKKIYKNILQNQNKYVKLLEQHKLKKLKINLPKIEMKTILKN